MPLKRKEWPGFTINPDEFYDMCAPLQYEEVGELMMALLRYCRTGKDPESLSNPISRIGYSRMKKKIMKEKQDYALTCYRRSHAGKKTWQQRKETEGSGPADSAAGYAPAGNGSSEKKKCYGFHCTVFLTDHELAQLQNGYSFAWEKLIQDYDQWAWRSKDAVHEGDLADLIEYATLYWPDGQLFPSSHRRMQRG